MNHPEFSLIRKRCVVRSSGLLKSGKPRINSHCKGSHWTQSGSDPGWKQFIFWLQVSFTAVQCFTCALLLGISSVYLVLSWLQGAGFHSGSSTFLSSLRHKPLSALGHKSSGSLVVRRQNKLLSAWTGHPKTQSMQIWVKQNEAEGKSSDKRPNSSVCSWLAERVDVIEGFISRHG